MTENQTKTVEQIVADLFVDQDEYVTSYRLAKIVSQVSFVREQMTYNYCAKGMIKTTNQNGQRLVSKTDAIEWAVKYLTKKLNVSE